jgi:hypothetical protein
MGKPIGQQNAVQIEIRIVKVVIMVEPEIEHNFSIVYMTRPITGKVIGM